MEAQRVGVLRRARSANAARLAIFVTDASPQEDGNTLTPKEV